MRLLVLSHIDAPPKEQGNRQVEATWHLMDVPDDTTLPPAGKIHLDADDARALLHLMAALKTDRVGPVENNPLSKIVMPAGMELPK